MADENETPQAADAAPEAAAMSYGELKAIVAEALLAVPS